MQSDNQTDQNQNRTSICRKVYGYVRVSGDSQSDKDGPVRQEHAIREYATAHGMIVDCVSFDNGVSGTIETLDRPQFKAMLDTMAATGVRTCIIEKLDRLSRDLLVAELAVQRVFKAQGIELLSTSEPDLMSSDPSRVFIRQILSAVAQMDRANICNRLAVARKRIRAAGGRCEGQKPYTHQDGGKDALQRVLALRNTGLGFDKIAQHLNAESIPTKHGKQWHGSSVRLILKQS